jgi:hypothetical protein
MRCHITVFRQTHRTPHAVHKHARPLASLPPGLHLPLLLATLLRTHGFVHGFEHGFLAASAAAARQARVRTLVLPPRTTIHKSTTTTTSTTTITLPFALPPATGVAARTASASRQGLTAVGASSGGPEGKTQPRVASAAQYARSTYHQLQKQHLLVCSAADCAVRHGTALWSWRITAHLLAWERSLHASCPQATNRFPNIPYMLQAP